jgi:hypothetical protein
VVGIAELRRTVQRKTGVLYDTYFTRRLSVYVTALLARTGVTPNQVSALNLLVGVGACGLIAFGEDGGVVAGAVLIHAYAILDSVDGELARLKRLYSLRGLFLEDWSAYTMINAFNLAVGTYLWRQGAGGGPLIGAILLAAFGRNAMPVARRAILKSLATARPDAGPEVQTAEPRRPPLPGAFIRDNLLHVTNMWVVVSIGLLLEAGLGLGGRWLVQAPFVFFLALWWLKELFVLARLLGSRALEASLGRTQLAARGRNAETDGRDLAEFDPL